MTPPIFPARERISLCMIVRDEARTLARALKSAIGWVGELIVVDTGSTDDTVAIAESFGAKVVHFAWCDDFAAARNAGLEAATREWALVLDADETLEVLNADALAHALAREDLAGFSLRCLNSQDDGGVVTSLAFRLFRRDWPAMRYRGALHEQVAAVADGQAATSLLDAARLNHDGYLHAARTAKGKTARNLALARKLVADRPDDPHAWYVLGMSLSESDPGEMTRAYERALALATSSGRALEGESYVLHLIYSLLAGYHRQGMGLRAREIADRGVAIFPHSPDLRFGRGTLRFDGGHHAQAADDFAACLTPEAAASPVILDPAHAGYKAQTALASAWRHLGRYEEAETLLVTALASAPEAYTEPRWLLGSMALQRGAWDEARALLASVLRHAPAHEQARFQLGWCLSKLEAYDEAVEALTPLQAQPEAQHLLGRVYLEMGNAAEALALLTACPLPAAGLARGWAFYVTDRATEAAACWDAWLRAGAADWGTKDTLATFLFLLQGGQRPSGQPERPAEPLRDMDQWFRLLLRYKRFDDVERVIQRGPGLGDRLWRRARRLWGITLAKEGFYDVGLALLLEARLDAPEDAEVYYWLGYCSLHKKHLEEAQVLWETCLRYAPDHTMAAQGLSLLRR